MSKFRRKNQSATPTTASHLHWTPPRLKVPRVRCVRIMPGVLALARLEGRVRLALIAVVSLLCLAASLTVLCFFAFLPRL